MSSVADPDLELKGGEAEGGGEGGFDLLALLAFFPTVISFFTHNSWGPGSSPRCATATSFPGSLFSASLGRWKKDPGCGWSHDHPESGWQKNLLGGRGSRVLCLVDVKNFVGFKSSSSR